MGGGEYAECPTGELEGRILPALGIEVVDEASNGGNVEYAADVIVRGEYAECPSGELEGTILPELGIPVPDDASNSGNVE